MVLINGNRRYKTSTNYIDSKVLLTDIDTGAQFYLYVKAEQTTVLFTRRILST